MVFKRIIRVYLIIGKTFSSWVLPIFTGLLILLLRLLVGISRILDYFIFPFIRRPLKSPIIIVGNPRSGTTFLHRYLIKLGFGTGSQLWQMVYPSITLQKIIRPILPIMEIISPARYHSTAAFFFTAGTITVAVAGFTLFTSFAGTCAITAFAFLITARFIFVFHNILQKRLT